MTGTKILRKLLGDKISDWKEWKDGHLAINRRWGTVTLRIFEEEIVITFSTNQYTEKLLSKVGVTLDSHKVSLADPEITDSTWNPIEKFLTAMHRIEKDHGGNRGNRKKVARQNNKRHPTL